VVGKVLEDVVIRVLASVFVVLGGVAIVSWMWPNGGDMMRVFRMAISAVSACVAVIVLVSLWKR